MYIRYVQEALIKSKSVSASSYCLYQTGFLKCCLFIHVHFFSLLADAGYSKGGGGGGAYIHGTFIY